MNSKHSFLIIPSLSKYMYFVHCILITMPVNDTGQYFSGSSLFPVFYIDIISAIFHSLETFHVLREHSIMFKLALPFLVYTPSRYILIPHLTILFYSIQFLHAPFNSPTYSNFHCNLLCGTLSNAFLISKSIQYTHATLSCVIYITLE